MTPSNSPSKTELSGVYSKKVDGVSSDIFRLINPISKQINLVFQLNSEFQFYNYQDRKYANREKYMADQFRYN